MAKNKVEEPEQAGKPSASAKRDENGESQGHEEAKGKSKKKEKEKTEKTDRCFKCLRGLLITFTVILVLVSLGLLGLGILIIIKEDLLLGGFKQSIKDKVKDAPKVAGSKDAGTGGDAKFEAVSTLLRTICIFMIALGAAFMVVCVLFFALACCCARKKKFLICFLVFIMILAIGQIVFLVIFVEASLIKDLFNGALQKIVIAAHEKNQFLILGLQDKFECCAVLGAKEYFCKAIYDARCNKGCKTDAFFCPTASRAPLDATSLPVCKTSDTLAAVASSDFRFSEVGGKEKFDKETAADPGCGEALWSQMHIGIIGVTAFAGFLVFLFLLAAFFTFYCIAKSKGKEEEKGTYDAANKVKDISVQTSMMEDKTSQTHRQRSKSPSKSLAAIERDGSSASDFDDDYEDDNGDNGDNGVSGVSGITGFGSRRVSPLVQPETVTPPGSTGRLHQPLNQMPDYGGNVRASGRGSAMVEIKTDRGVWYQKRDGTWSLRKMSDEKLREK